MKLLDLINSCGNWREILSLPPYNLIIRDLGPYTLCKYNQIESDMSNPIVREARGCIFMRVDANKYKCVCYPFDKFFNYGEPANDIEIDWDTAEVQEKVDGSLIKLWHGQDGWHVSTNGSINADDANVNEDMTFGDLWFKAWLKLEDAYYYDLDPNYTYMFELVSPYNQVVIQYDTPEIYYLGRRNMTTLKEDRGGCPWEKVKVPKRYPLHSLEDCKNAAAALKLQGEGFVVCDANFNRIKVKSPDYVLAHKIATQRPLTLKTVLEMIDEEIIDDYLSIKPSAAPFVNDVIKQRKELLEKMGISWNKIKYWETDKEFAMDALKYPWSGWLFAKRKGKDFKIDAKYLLKFLKE